MDAANPAMTTVEKAALLIEVDLFREVPSDALAELAARMDETAHPSGEILLEPGTPDPRVWVIVEGQVEIRRGTSAAGVLSRGNAFGLWAALGLDQQETVLASGPCRMLSVAPEEYLDAMADSPAFAVSTLRALGRRLQASESVIGPS